MRQKKKKRLTKTQKERIHNHLTELANILDKKEIYKNLDYNDLDYFGIRDRENLFININNSDYYGPILVKSSFENNYEYYEIRGDKTKKLSIKQYLSMITPHLTKLINERKNNKNEQKIQLSMGVSFMCITDSEKTRSFYVNSNNEEIRIDDNAIDIINKLYESFLNNHQKKEQILRNGSNYTFESIDILGVHFHDIRLKRGKSYIKSPEWIANKKATINPKNAKDNKCFQEKIRKEYRILSLILINIIGKI